MPDSALPAGWKFHAIGELARERVERSPNGATIPVYSVTKHRGFVPSLEYFDRQVFSKDTANYKVVREGDLAYATIHLDEGSIGLLDSVDLALISPMYTVIDVDKNRIHPRYLFALLKQPSMLREYFRIKEGTVHRRWSVSFKDLARVQVAVPDRRGQDAILEVLDAIDAAIEKTEAVIAATERLRSALLGELLKRGVPGWHTEWKQAPGIGTIPACWEVVRLGDVADVQTGRQVGKAPGNGVSVILPYLSVANVKDGYLHLETVKTIAVGASEVARFSLRPGDVLFTEGGDADKLGRGCVWSGEINPCLHQNHVFAVRPHGGRLLPDLLAAYARSPRGKSYFMGCSKQTTNLASINSTQLKAMPLPLPPLDEQRAMLELLGSVAARADSENAGLETLIAIKRATAASLLSGRVRIGHGDA